MRWFGALLALAGAAVGALAGVITGAPFRSWQAIYKARGTAPQQ